MPFALRCEKPISKKLKCVADEANQLWNFVFQAVDVYGSDVCGSWCLRTWCLWQLVLMALVLCALKEHASWF
jgi:hypothetical protein